MVASDIKLRLRENVKKFQLIDIIFLSTYCGQHIKVMSGMMPWQIYSHHIRKYLVYTFKWKKYSYIFRIESTQINIK